MLRRPVTGGKPGGRRPRHGVTRSAGQLRTEGFVRLDAVAIVPAGGAARRLGPLGAGGKAALLADGRTFLDRVSGVLAAEVSRVIVVAAPGDAVPVVPAAVEVIRDTHPGAGPLAAVCDGLVHAAAAPRPPRLAVLCSCDAPLVTPGVVRLLLERASRPGVRWALPVVDGHPQPLLSAVTVDLVDDLLAELASGRSSLRGVAADLDSRAPGCVQRLGVDEVRAVDPGLVSFLDVDTPDDLARVRGRVGELPRGG